MFVQTHLLIQRTGSRPMPGGRAGSAAACWSVSDSSEGRKHNDLFFPTRSHSCRGSSTYLSPYPDRKGKSGPSPFGHRLLLMLPTEERATEGPDGLLGCRSQMQSFPLWRWAQRLLSRGCEKAGFVFLDDFWHWEKPDGGIMIGPQVKLSGP